ncbi:hypothetical protein M1403_03045 [Patescibacteria group bacterium]|nr:hypothetical protein [Patescibacteria group bacterium]
MLYSIETSDGFSRRNRGERDFLVELKDHTLNVDSRLRNEAQALLATELRYQGLCKEEFRAKRRLEVADLRSKRTSPYIPVADKQTLGPFTFGTVNGKRTRKEADPHFAQGGQPKVYDYIPPRTFVAEEALDPQEIPVTWLHEFSEYLFMSLLLPYDPAHFIADKLEGLARKVLINFAWRDIREHQPAPVKGD